MNGIEEKNVSKQSNNIILVLVLLLNVISCVCNLVMNRGVITLQICLSLFMFILVVFYALYDYRRPHGNNMRYVLLVYAISVAAVIAVSGKIQPTYLTINYLVVVILSSYMAGRLDHYKHNMVISAIIFVCCIISCYSLIDVLPKIGLPINFVNIMACLGTITTWIAIAVTYIIRFKDHKQAGLEDKN